MPRLALVALAAYFALAFGWRTWRQWQQTGSTGFRGISGAPGSAEWCGGVLFVAALVGAVLAPIADLNGWLQRNAALDHDVFRVVGILLFLGGASITLLAQLAMGASWRIGVDPSERTPLVAHGPFRLVRNPIFTGMAIALGGIALLTPNVLALVTLVALLVAIELQVRLVEEPYLARLHGNDWRRYAVRTGRFVPDLGRWRDHT